MSCIWPSIIGALALAAPLPPATGHSLSVRLCGGAPGLNLSIPLDTMPPADDHGCCKGRACHAGCERRTPRKAARP